VVYQWWTGQRVSLLAWLSDIFCSVQFFNFPVFVDQSQAELRPLLCIAGFIHDLEGFVGDHPGGELLLRKYIGKDATAAFFGGVYNHSNAAHNVSF